MMTSHVRSNYIYNHHHHHHHINYNDNSNNTSYIDQECSHDLQLINDQDLYNIDQLPIRLTDSTNSISSLSSNSTIITESESESESDLESSDDSDNHLIYTKDNSSIITLIKDNDSNSIESKPEIKLPFKSSLKLFTNNKYKQLKRSNSEPNSLNSINQDNNNNTTNIKKVRFASNLTRIKTFCSLSEPINVKSNKEEIISPLFYNNNSINKKAIIFNNLYYSDDDDDETLSSDEEEFNNSSIQFINFNLNNSNSSNHPLIQLKSIELLIKSNQLIGKIHVLNLNFEKKLEIKYCFNNNWDINFINLCKFNKSIDYKIDEFEFNINLINNNNYSNSIQFCIIYYTNNQIFYENNNYQNFIIKFNQLNIKSSINLIDKNFTNQFNHKYEFLPSSSLSSSSSNLNPSSNISNNQLSYNEFLSKYCFKTS
ncbi:hypothetical protein WICMUC_001796 [Wickerhamomyces mucosus]|uniref:CBM21 domain-containing protein n=1 Tax=Wickerhamomyces mucosus TaxID=1378264 RepID=A0A9P8PT78_9ASCO|nr:hypothetical protein WICMUC_001796 [Wickerhamomyces mucosus]